MAGHSKWHNIKNKKAATDSKKAKVFSQLARLIRVAVKEGKSGDPKHNNALRLLLEKSRSANMPKDKVQKAIDCGLGKGSAANIKEVIYEGFGPGGIGLLIVAFTDNTNRTSAELRGVLSRTGGSLGSPGSVMYMFKRGQEGDYVCTIPLKITDEDAKKKITGLLDQLLSMEDIEDVYTSMKE